MLQLRILLPILTAVLVAACGPAPRLNVVIVSLDTTRADRLGAYGYGRDTSPNFDALAAESVLFERAYSQSVLTSPSHASMMTGLRPHSHGTLFNGERMTTAIPTLAERLRKRGYQTAGFVSAVVLAPSASDVSRGFETFDAEFPALRRGARVTTDRAMNWLRSRDLSAPYFLFVHYYDSHGPFRVEPDVVADFRRDVPPHAVTVPPYQQLPNESGEMHDDIEYYSDVYDAAIHQQDGVFGDLLHSIDRDRTILIVLADHGESFDERLSKINHGTYVYDEQVHIPLLVHVPGLEARRVSALVETTDIVPSLLEWLGSEPSDSLDGHSFIESLRHGADTERTNATSIAEARATDFVDRDYRLDPRFPIASVVEEEAPRWKLIRYPDVRGPIYELHRLDTDPAETVDLASAEPKVVERLTAKLYAELPDLAGKAREHLDVDLQVQLKALGYAE